MTLDERLREIQSLYEKAKKLTGHEESDCGVTEIEYDFLNALYAAWPDIAALLSERRWQPIETAPKSGIGILLYQPWKSGYDTVMIGHYANGWVWQDASKDGELWEIQPTHWMHLPKAPE